MAGRLDMMNAIREGLHAINFAAREPTGEWVRWEVWTQLVLAALCKVGQERFRCYVCTDRRHASKAEHGEWLTYDMMWLEYTSHTRGNPKTSGSLIGAHLVAECEWSSTNRSIGDIEDDFSKLLLARAGVRLMVCYEWGAQWRHEKIKDARGLADHLAGWIQRFNGARAEDLYLLAVLSGEVDGSGLHRVRYFTLGLNGVAAEPWA